VNQQHWGSVLNPWDFCTGTRAEPDARTHSQNLHISYLYYIFVFIFWDNLKTRKDWSWLTGALLRKKRLGSGFGGLKKPTIRRMEPCTAVDLPVGVASRLAHWAEGVSRILSCRMRSTSWVNDWLHTSISSSWGDLSSCPSSIQLPVLFFFVW
jgi:hypothetical protein